MDASSRCELSASSSCAVECLIILPVEPPIVPQSSPSSRLAPRRPVSCQHGLPLGPLRPLPGCPWPMMPTHLVLSLSNCALCTAACGLIHPSLGARTNHWGPEGGREGQMALQLPAARVDWSLGPVPSCRGLGAQNRTCGAGRGAGAGSPSGSLLRRPSSPQTTKHRALHIVLL